MYPPHEHRALQNMRINAEGWLTSAKHYQSPHCDERPAPSHLDAKESIDLLVLHNISLPPSQFGDAYVHALFMGELNRYRHQHPFFKDIAHLRVSAHFYIARDGQIIQYVATTQRAWHAGVSSYHGRPHCNDFSIGIELNGTDHTPYTLAQYQSLSRLTQAIMLRHPDISTASITTHAHIAPSRKTDPGPAFNHRYFARLLQIN